MKFAEKLLEGYFRGSWRVEEGCRADPKFARAWVQLAIVQAIQGQNDAALDALRGAIDAEPKQIGVRKLYAYILGSSRRYETARQAWLDILKLSPDDPEAISMAGLLSLDNRYADAVPYLEALAKASPSANNQIRLGSVYLGQARSKKVRPRCRRCWRWDPKAGVFERCGV